MPTNLLTHNPPLNPPPKKIPELHRHIQRFKKHKSGLQSDYGNTSGKVAFHTFLSEKTASIQTCHPKYVNTEEHSSSGADLSGFVLARQAALALRFFGPVSLQVRSNDGIERHRPPHAGAQLLWFGLSSC